jgi:hypothetical protein
MADSNGKLRIAPKEIFALVERLQGRARSIVFKDMPETQRDIPLAARLLKHLLENSVIVDVIILC